MSQSKDIDLVEVGHAKEGVEADIFNYSIAYNRNNREPLFYEAYSESVVDISQLQYTLKKAKSYGYDFVIMIKGMKSLVNEIVLDVQGTFENQRKK